MLQNRVLPEIEVYLMVQRRKGDLKLLLDSKAQEEMENGEISLVNALIPGDTGLVARSSPPLLATPKRGPREPIAPPTYDKQWVSTSKTHQST